MGTAAHLPLLGGAAAAVPCPTQEIKQTLTFRDAPVSQHGYISTVVWIFLRTQRIVKKGPAG
jgi:hypothetical protein